MLNTAEQTGIKDVIMEDLSQPVVQILDEELPSKMLNFDQVVDEQASTTPVQSPRA